MGSAKVLILIPTDGKTAERVVLQGDDKVYVGRSSRCQVRLPGESRMVSRLHASLSCLDGDWYITDESRRGTFLHGEKLSPGQPHSIAHGAVLRFGDCEFIAHLRPSDELDRTDAPYTLSSQVVRLGSIDTARVLQAAFELPELLARATDEASIYSAACEYLVQTLSPVIATALVASVDDREQVTVLGRAERTSAVSTTRTALQPVISRRVVAQLREAPDAVVFMRRGLEGPALNVTVSGSLNTIGAARLDTDSTGSLVVLYVVGDVVLASGDVLVAQYLRLLSTLVRQHLLTRRQAHLTKYFSPNVVRLILERDPQTDIDCEPRVAKATSFFFDVRGSSLPLAASAEERSRLYVELRQVLSVVTDAVFATGGTIIDYAGDGVFAVWGVPRAQMDQADRAVGCALRVLHSLQGARFVTLGTPAQLCGIGIASGEVLVGSVGSSVMFKYGVFGPSVSVAQRLAMLTKPDALDRPILISDDVQRELGRYQRGVRYVGQVPLRGMDSIVEAFEVLPGTAHDAADEWQH